MANVVVWSERDDPRGGYRWRDCTYSSYLMALVYGGKTYFPKGIYTAAEREALESADDRPDETGGNYPTIDVGSRRRYGITLKTPTIGIAAALGRTGYGLAIMGKNSNLSYSHSLRRWDRKYTGNHAVFVIPLGGGKVRWLDPLATWKFAGDIVTVATVLKWIGTYTSTFNWREIQEDSIVVSPSPGETPPGPGPAPTPTVTLKYGGYAGYRGTWKVNSGGGRFRSSPFIRSTNLLEVAPAGFIWSNSQTADQGDLVNGSRRWLGDATGNRWQHVSVVTLVK